MTESGDQSNSHQSAPRKQKNSIKNKIHNFFKPGIETQLLIKNMVLNDIPTQTTPVFIHIRQGRERIDTQTVKIIDNTATWQDEIIIDSRVPSIDTQQPQQQPQNNTNANSNNGSAPQPTISMPQRPNSMSNIHDYDNYDNYDNYEYEQPDDNDISAPASTRDQQPTSESISKNQEKSERSEKRKEKKERRELERREKKEKKEKEKRERKENKEKERKEKKERKPQNLSSFFLEFTFRLEDVSGRSSTIYGKTVLDLTQITSANDWEYRAVLHECNYNSIFSCLISIDNKKRKSSAMVESLPPLPTSSTSSNSSLNSANKPPSQTGSFLPPAKMPSSLNSSHRNRIDRDRSYSDKPVRKIPIHESISLDGIKNISNNNYVTRNTFLVENTDGELNDNIYIDDNNNNSEQIPSTSSKRSKLSSSMKSSKEDNSNSTKKSSGSSRSHGHSRGSHSHRKNELSLKSAASTIIIPLDQNTNDDEFEEKLPFKVQKDRLERLSDQVDDIINNAFYGFSEE